MSVTIRNYRENDLEALVDLVNAADEADQLDEGTTTTELGEDFAEPGYRPLENVFVVEDETGHIVGSGRLRLDTSPKQSKFWAMLTVHPSQREEGIEKLLLERLWEQATKRRGDVLSERVHFRTYCATHQARLLELFEQLGLEPIRYSPHMVCQPLEHLKQPQFPPGIEVRPYIKGRDDESALEAFNEAFAEDRQFVPETLEGWVHWFDSSRFRQDLSSVALDGDDVIGFSLCIISEDRIKQLGRRDGYVDTLYVRPAYRRRGLGTALLLAGLHTLVKAGMESATLDTNADNPTQPMRLYEKVGFKELWRWVQYGKEMP